jgi:hypothetical protein
VIKHPHTNNFAKHSVLQSELHMRPYYEVVSPIHYHMVNESYEPTEKDELVLDALKKGRSNDEPWGRANPRWLINETGLNKSNVEFCLRSLRDAGWIERVARGLYELSEDPRQK